VRDFGALRKGAGLTDQSAAHPEPRGSGSNGERPGVEVNALFGKEELIKKSGGKICYGIDRGANDQRYPQRISSRGLIQEMAATALPESRQHPQRSSDKRVERKRPMPSQQPSLSLRARLTMLHAGSAGSQTSPPRRIPRAVRS